MSRVMAIGVLILALACDEGVNSPVDRSSRRSLTPAFEGETGVLIHVNGNPLSSQSDANKLRVEFDINGPTFGGSNDNKTVFTTGFHDQADSVRPNFSVVVQPKSDFRRV